MYLDATTDKEVSSNSCTGGLTSFFKVVKIRQTSDHMITRNILTYLVMMITTEISYTIRPLLEQDTTVVRGNHTVLVRPMPLSTWFPFNPDQKFYVSQLLVMGWGWE